MTKNDFIALAAERAGMTKKDLGVALEAIDDVLLEEVIAKEDSVRLKIGTISGYTKHSEARKARNPRTGETIQVPAKTIHGYPKFKPSKLAKE